MRLLNNRPIHLQVRPYTNRMTRSVHRYKRRNNPSPDCRTGWRLSRAVSDAIPAGKIIVFKVKDGPLIGEINSEAQPNC